MLNEIVHIGITVSDMERSISFYRNILGLEYKGELMMEGPETDMQPWQNQDCSIIE